MDKTERDLRRYLRRKQAEKHAGRRALVGLVAVVVLLALLLKLIDQTHIVFFFSL